MRSGSRQESAGGIRSVRPQPADIEVSAPVILARKPRVSVLTITYNHGKYVEECIRSVLAQRAKFDIEMVIGEDCSKDDTRAVCRKLQAESPDRIRLLLPGANVGRFENFRRTYAACRSEFIALLEGDDVWTATDKLQCQVDALDAHPEWIACFHNVRIVAEGRTGKTATFFTDGDQTVFRQCDFAERNFVPTCSCVFRRRPDLLLPAWYYDESRNPYSDWILHAVNARYGDFGYLHEVMALHRRHAGGVWGGTFDGTLDGDIRRMARRLTAFEGLEEVMAPEHRARVRRQRALGCFHLALAYREKGRMGMALQLLLRACWIDPTIEAPLIRTLAATLLRPHSKGKD
jgi:glycosyltransferase involved in cell wall biosynthesis